MAKSASTAKQSPGYLGIPKRGMWAGGVAVCLGLVILVGSWLFSGPESPQAAATRVASEQARLVAIQPAKSTNDTCDGKVRPLKLGSSWSDVSKGGTCRFVHNLGSKVVLFKDHDGEYRSAGWQTRNPIEARTADGEVNLFYSLCPLESGIKPINWDCTPRTRA